MRARKLVIAGSKVLFACCNYSTCQTSSPWLTKKVNQLTLKAPNFRHSARAVEALDPAAAVAKPLATSSPTTAAVTKSARSNYAPCHSRCRWSRSCRWLNPILKDSVSSFVKQSLSCGMKLGSTGVHRSTATTPDAVNRHNGSISHPSLQGTFSLTMTG